MHSSHKAKIWCNDAPLVVVCRWNTQHSIGARQQPEHSSTTAASSPAPCTVRSGDLTGLGCAIGAVLTSHQNSTAWIFCVRPIGARVANCFGEHDEATGSTAICFPEPVVERFITLLRPNA